MVEEREGKVPPTMDNVHPSPVETSTVESKKKKRVKPPSLNLEDVAQPIGNDSTTPMTPFDFQFSPSNLLTASLSRTLPFSPALLSPSGLMFSPTAAQFASGRTPRRFGFDFDESAVTKEQGEALKRVRNLQQELNAKNEQIEKLRQIGGGSPSTSPNSTSSQQHQQHWNNMNAALVAAANTNNLNMLAAMTPRRAEDDEIWGATLGALFDQNNWNNRNQAVAAANNNPNERKRALPTSSSTFTASSTNKSEKHVKRVKSCPPTGTASGASQHSTRPRTKQQQQQRGAPFVPAPITTTPFLARQQQQHNHRGLYGAGANNMYSKPQNQISPAGSSMMPSNRSSSINTAHLPMPLKPPSITGCPVKLAGKRWTKKQDEQLRAAVKKYNSSNWKAIADNVEGRNHVQCLQRWKKVLQPGLVKGMWSQEEDNLLLRLMEEFGNEKSWTKIAERIPGRTAKQCRERWHLNLDPTINRGPWTAKEDDILLSLHNSVGNKWAQIKRSLPGRTENGVKSRFKSIQRAMLKDPRFAAMKQARIAELP